MATSPGKRAEHQEALDRFVQREYELLDLFDQVAASVGILTAGYSIIENEFVTERKGKRTFKPIVLDGPLHRSSLILTESFIETETRIRDSFSSPDAAEVPIGTRRSVQMGLQAYPGMPEEAAEQGTFYSRPRLIILSDPDGNFMDVAMQPKNISPQRLPLAQFEQVMFRNLIDDVAATRGL